MVMVNGIGAHLTNDQKRAHLIDLKTRAPDRSGMRAGNFTAGNVSFAGLIAGIPRGGHVKKLTLTETKPGQGRNSGCRYAAPVPNTTAITLGSISYEMVEFKKPGDWDINHQPDINVFSHAGSTAYRLRSASEQ
jgi:hypothetical protein